MDIESIRQKLYTDFDAEGIAARQEKKRKAEAKVQAAMPVPPAPVDIYQRNQDRIYDVSQKTFPNGSSRIVNVAVASVIDGAGAEGLARAFKRAKDDSDSLVNRGERGRAELVRGQYMQESFLPAVEIVANSASPDELLANEKALSDLDQYVLLPGKASGKGYTASYLRQAYGNQLGQVEGRSDATVRSGVQRINALLDQGMVREALGIANGLKKKLDKGEAMADEADAELVGRIISFYA